MRILLLSAVLVLQGPPRPATPDGAISGQILGLDGTPAAGLRVSALAVPPPTSGVNGKWVTTGVVNGPWTIELKLDGTRLTGTTDQQIEGDKRTFEAGTISGNVLGFTVNSKDGLRTITYVGAITGDQITFARTFNIRPNGGTGGDGIYGEPGPAVFVAKRVPPEVLIISLAQTDRQGHYRVENLPPGAYRILAGPFDKASYFPGVRSETDARVITVNSGASIDGVDFRLAPPQTFSVTGRVVVGAGTTDAVPPTEVALVCTGLTLVSPIAADGTFEFRNLRPCSYHAAASSRNLLGVTDIPVVDRDVTGVTLLVSSPGPTFTVGGHVTGDIATAGGGVSNDHARAQVELHDGSAPGVVNAANLLQTATIAPDGSFEFAHVNAGAQQLVVARTRPKGAAGSTELISLPSSILIDRDIADVRLATLPLVRVSGTISLAGSAIPPIVLTLTNADPTFGSRAVGIVGREFAFDMRPGEWRVTWEKGPGGMLSGIPPGYVMQAITAGSVDLKTEPLRVGLGNSPQIVITLGASAPR